MAGLLVGCGDSGDKKKSPQDTHEQLNGSSSGTSKYLKFDEEFIANRESAEDKYYMVTCENVEYSYNDVEYGDIASYEHISNLVDSSETGNMEPTIKDGKLFFGEQYNFKIIGDYGKYAVVQISYGDFIGSYTYWYPKPINDGIKSAFWGQGDSYMDNTAYRFKHQGRCTPNSLNEHIADWKSLQK